MSSYKPILATLFIFLMLLLPSISAFEWDNVVSDKPVADGESYRIGDRTFDYNRLWMEYKPFEVTNMLGLGDKLAEAVLTSHTETCGENCLSEFTICTSEESAPIDAVYFYRLDKGQREKRNIRGYNFEYIGDIIDYTIECSPAKLTEDEIKNETKPYETCVQVESGSHKGLINYNVGDIKPAGCYDYTLTGQKASYMSIDWVIKTQGKLIESWATWGNRQTINTSLIDLGINARTTKQGVFFYVTQNNTIQNVTKFSSSDATKLYLAYANGTAIKTIDFVGNIGIVDYNVTIGRNYTLKVDSSGASYTCGGSYGAGAPTLPYTRDTFIFYATDDCNYGTTTVANIQNITYLNSNANAFVTLNSPANGAVSTTTNITTNASATVTGGATLVNATLYDNSTGSWGNRNTTTLNGVTITNLTEYSPSVPSQYNTLKNITINGFVTNVTQEIKSATTNNIFRIEYYYNDNTVVNQQNQTSAGSYVNVTYINPNPTKVVTNVVIKEYYDSGTTSVRGTYIKGLNQSSFVFTFTNTYTSSPILWNYQFCDSDGACGFATSNRTFSIDGVAPTITLNYPTSLINYGVLNETLQLNFTATDSNLANVWYDYNGTNVSIVGALSGIANLSNITLIEGDSNLTIYANDTAGNLNTTSYSWDYKVFENSRTITTPTIETTLETFTINVTANSSLTSVYLNWNGTEYSASGSAGVYTKTLTIPAVSIAETIPVYWRFDYSGINITSTTSNQVVNKLVFQLCNVTVNKTLINFTTRSSDNPFPLVNSSFKSNWRLAASIGATPTTFNYEDLVQDNSSYAFCTNINTTTFYVSTEIEYAATGYATNFYYLNDAELIANDTENINLYLLNDTRATTTVLRVEDTAQKPYENYTVQIQSYDVGTGTFYTVGMAQTDYKGEDVVYLNWYNTLYKFIISDTNGNVVKTTGTTKITGTPTIIEISTDVVFVYDKFENFVYNLYYDNATHNFVLTYTMPSGEVDSACLRVYKETSLNQTLICDTCETSSSATVFCNIAGKGEGRFTAVFYALGSHKLIDWIDEYIGGRFQEEVYAALGNEDASFYAFLFAGIVTVALFVNAVFGIIALLIGLLGASALGFTAIQWAEMMGVIIVGGFIIWIIKR